MRIGNLSRASIRSRGIFAFQMMRVFIVAVLAATGAFALSLSVEDQSASPESVAASGPQHESASAARTVEGAEQTAPVQVANADPLAAAPMDGSGIPSAAPEPPVQESASAPAPADTGSDQAAAPPAVPSGEAQAPETRQAAQEPSSHMPSPNVPSPNVPSPPAAEDMTGAVAVANVPTAPDPASDLIDLNTASFEQLNSLRNAGPLGRAIIKGRPYRSVEDLVTRKVLRRSVYEKIKDQVTVR